MFGLKSGLNFAVNWDAKPQNSMVRSLSIRGTMSCRGDPPEDANATAVQGREGHLGLAWHKEEDAVLVGFESSSNHDPSFNPTFSRSNLTDGWQLASWQGYINQFEAIPFMLRDDMPLNTHAIAWKQDEGILGCKSRQFHWQGHFSGERRMFQHVFSNDLAHRLKMSVLLQAQRMVVAARGTRGWRF